MPYSSNIEWTILMWHTWRWYHGYAYEALGYRVCHLKVSESNGFIVGHLLISCCHQMEFYQWVVLSVMLLSWNTLWRLLMNQIAESKVYLTEIRWRFEDMGWYELMFSVFGHILKCFCPTKKHIIQQNTGNSHSCSKRTGVGWFIPSWVTTILKDDIHIEPIEITR